MHQLLQTEVTINPLTWILNRMRHAPSHISVAIKAELYDRPGKEQRLELFGFNEIMQTKTLLSI